MSIRYGDLEKTITLREVEKELEFSLSGEISDLVLTIVEHWSDDEGLHMQPFEDDLRKSLKDKTGEILSELSWKGV